MPPVTLADETTPQPHELGLVGQSPAQKKLWAEINQCAPLNLDVTLLGESGTGKTTVASIIHQLSERSTGPFRQVNCANLPPEMLESELFGTEKGSFTSAVSRRGLFEQASGGTLFLDEVGELSQDIQAKLLTVVESKTIRRLGGSREIPCDVRLIYATKRQLSELREDFRYRLDGAVIRVPTLSERVEDIPEHVVYQFAIWQAKLNRKQPFDITEDAMRAFASYTWPGNIRELSNVVLKIAIMRSQLGDENDGQVDAEIVASTIELVRRLSQTEEGQSWELPAGNSNAFARLQEVQNVSIPHFILDFRQGENFDSYIDRVLIESYEFLMGFGFSHKRAASYLGIPRTSLYKRLLRAKVSLKPDNTTPALAQAAMGMDQFGG